MSLLETKLIDQITVTESGIILVREVTRITRDGVQIAETYHRTSICPGEDLTGQPAQVANIANAAWTPEVIAAFEAATATQPE